MMFFKLISQYLLSKGFWFGSPGLVFGVMHAELYQDSLWGMAICRGASVKGLKIDPLKGASRSLDKRDHGT